MALVHGDVASIAHAHDLDGGTSATLSFDSAGGTVLIAGISQFTTAGSGTCTGVTYNSVSLTQLGTEETSDLVNKSLWFLRAPAAGTNDLVATSDQSEEDITTVAVSITGAKSVNTGNVEQSNATAVSSIADSVLNTTSGSLIIDWVDIFGNATNKACPNWLTKKSSEDV